MNTPKTLTPRLFAGLGTLTLLGGIGLAASRPAHTAGGPIAVNVANTPLPTTDTTLAGRTPFSKRLDLTFVYGYTRGTYVVPAGKRLVLTYVSADASVAIGTNVLLGLSTVNDGAEVEAHLPTTAQGEYLGKDVFATSAPMTVYADPGSTVTFAALQAEGGAGETGGLVVSLYGYLENV